MVPLTEDASQPLTSRQTEKPRARRVRVIVIVLCACLLLVARLQTSDVSALWVQWFHKDKEGAVSSEHLFSSTLSYQGEAYVQMPWVKFEKSLLREHVLIGWDDAGAMRYYAAEETSPDYMLCYLGDMGWSALYIKQTIAYKQEPFILEGTTERFLLSDVITGAAFHIDPIFHRYKDEQTFSVRCESLALLSIQVTVFYYEDNYYARLETEDTAYSISDEFWELLIEHDVITPAYDRPRNADAPSVPDNAS